MSILISLALSNLIMVVIKYRSFVRYLGRNGLSFVENDEKISIVEVILAIFLIILPVVGTMFSLSLWTIENQRVANMAQKNGNVKKI